MQARQENRLATSGLRMNELSGTPSDEDKHLQYLGEAGEAGEVGEYFGDDGDICAGEVGESTADLAFIDAYELNRNLHRGDAGLKEGLVGEYLGDVGLKDGDCGLYRGDVGENDGDVGGYRGLVG